jgi:hypothetical protein
MVMGKDGYLEALVLSEGRYDRYIRRILSNHIIKIEPLKKSHLIQVSATVVKKRKEE